jgi:hypothetical protein
MTIIIAFSAASFIASALIISACALSSRLSQQGGVEESYPDVTVSKTAPATPVSQN